MCVCVCVCVCGVCVKKDKRIGSSCRNSMLNLKLPLQQGLPLVTYHLWLPFLINRMLNLTTLRRVILSL